MLRDITLNFEKIKKTLTKALCNHLTQKTAILQPNLISNTKRAQRISFLGALSFSNVQNNSSQKGAIMKMFGGKSTIPI
ncbi:hypothetical protein ABNC33_06825 [Paenibacillus larvae]|uniref:Uncharacterized protein n=4 Tax=Fernvirus TaxID=2843380 RepID=A0A0C5AF45_9CAUD|nr:hypothetical protein AXJ12_gp25 [Paenibacillus phage Rani]YP_009838861.1 hypothetical protein HWB73_gp25 [Paenibacillus phage Eltigre]AJK27884.1 hypothetical protein REDBUD_25 [Bacteriophage Redbud]AUS03648.1 hypothetical protein KIEL007_25 [Paenibacillus phage Kiel007]QVV19367.1 hypothetical protein AlexiD_25 [Paenibacillus phage AlexiD]QVV19768.1 hypothetical protein JackPlaque_25 [Paenibacillus phage JackPlaque]AJK27823.1 hypothetical protein RANI_25 [Paenibacillus phage Rani]